ncbi:hypothetical protein IWX49DRAFT_202540 [Phyllosticta citricarpa]
MPVRKCERGSGEIPRLGLCSLNLDSDTPKEERQIKQGLVRSLMHTLLSISFLLAIISFPPFACRMDWAAWLRGSVTAVMGFSFLDSEDIASLRTACMYVDDRQTEKTPSLPCHNQTAYLPYRPSACCCYCCSIIRTYAQFEASQPQPQPHPQHPTRLHTSNKANKRTRAQTHPAGHITRIQPASQPASQSILRQPLSSRLVSSRLVGRSSPVTVPIAWFVYPVCLCGLDMWVRDRPHMLTSPCMPRRAAPRRAAELGEVPRWGVGYEGWVDGWVGTGRLALLLQACKQGLGHVWTRCLASYILRCIEAVEVCA